MTQNLIASVIIGLALIGGGYILSNNQVTTINTPAVNGTLETSAEGRVSVAPNMVVLTLSVQSRANTSKLAYDQTNASVNELKSLLKSAGIADIDMQTTSLYLNPEYTYTDGNPKPNGFSATHTLAVKIRKLPDANTILDQAAAIANVQIQSISYDLDKKDPIYTEARKMALEKARVKAEEMAKVANVKIKKVQSISENVTSTDYPLPYQNARMAPEADMVWNATSISAGQLEYTTVVNVTYELE